MTILFWTDWWTGGDSFINRFPNLFEASLLKYASVYNMFLKWTSFWDDSMWIRPLNGTELLECRSIFESLRSLSFRRGEDELLWQGKSNPVSAKDLYSLLDDSPGVQGDWRKIWKLKIPYRLKLFQ